MSTPKRRRGRPRKFKTGASIVSVRLPVDLHDALIREAIKRQVELSDIIRERLRQ